MSKEIHIKGEKQEYLFQGHSTKTLKEKKCQIRGNEITLMTETGLRTFFVKPSGEGMYTLYTDNISINLEHLSSEQKILEKIGLDPSQLSVIKEIKAPMPGLILSIQIKEGDSVQKGDTVLTLEAMKMENTIKSPAEGVIKSVKVAEGQKVEKNEMMIEFE